MSPMAPNEDLLVETYEAIKWFMDDRGYPPTVRELGKRLGLSSASSARGRLDALIAAGMVERGPGPRALRLKARP
jgi:repressor LexA